jgi:hypothetical protein
MYDRVRGYGKRAGQRPAPGGCVRLLVPDSVIQYRF